MKINFTPTPSTQDIDFLTLKINQETTDGGSAYPFGFFIRNTANEMIAGCNGSVVFGAIYTDQLWVHPDYRNQGLARKLMEQIHKHGRENGCTMATVATISFQNAQSFYEALGYQPDFERPGYINGSSCVFLKKSL